MHGWIFIIKDTKHPELVKICHSDDIPEQRLKELKNINNHETLSLSYAAFVEEASRIEIIIHKNLKEKKFHVESNWFRCSLEIAIEEFKKNNIAGSILAEYYTDELFSVDFLKNMNNTVINIFEK